MVPILFCRLDFSSFRYWSSDVVFDTPYASVDNFVYCQIRPCSYIRRFVDFSSFKSAFPYLGATAGEKKSENRIICNRITK